MLSSRFMKPRPFLAFNGGVRVLLQVSGILKTPNRVLPLE